MTGEAGPRRLWGGLAFAVSAATAVVLGFLCFEPPTAVGLARAVAYPSLLALVVALLWLLWRVTPVGRLADPAWWRRQAPAVALIVVTSGFLVSREPADFKVMMDDITIATAAMGLHFHRDPGLVTVGHEILGLFTPLHGFMDKRPILFPLLVSVVHDLTGYRIENSFAVNRGLTVVLVALVFAYGRRLGGVRAGVVATLLLTTLPMLARCASGGGLEVLNVVLLLTALHLAVGHLERPTAASQNALVLALVVLAYSRYEAGLYAIPGAAVVLLGWWRERSLRWSWALFAAPLALVPLALQLAAFKVDQGRMWEVPRGLEQPFSVAYVGDNLRHAFDFLFLFSAESYGSALIAGAAVVAVLLLGLVVIRARRVGRPLSDALKVLLLFALAVLAFDGLLMGYGWGQIDKYEVSRLMLPFFTVAILLVVSVLFTLWPGPRTAPVAAAVIAMYLAFFTLPALAVKAPLHRGFDLRRMNWTWQRYQELPAGRYLVFTPDRSFWALHRVSALQPWQLAHRLDQVAYHRRYRTFADVLVIQRLRLDPATGEEAVWAEDAVPGSVVLETLAETSIRPFVLCRLSRIVAIEPGRPSQTPILDPTDRRHLDPETLEEHYGRLP